MKEQKQRRADQNTAIVIPTIGGGGIVKGQAATTGDVATIGGWTLGWTTITSTGVTLTSGSAASIAFGTTPPTSPTAGTGIFIDQTGLYGLAAGVQLTSISATTGAITATSATITGTITATAGAIGGWTIGATTISSTGVTLTSGSLAYIAFGTTPPTGPSTGTGIYIDKTGLYGLLANVQEFKISAGDGSLTAISGQIGGWSIGATVIQTATITLDSAGSQIRAGTGPGVTIDGAGEKITIGANTPRFVIDGSSGNKYIRTSTYTSGLQGFNLSGLNGDAEFNNVLIRGSISAAVFTYNQINATAGTLGVFKSAGKLKSDFTSVTTPTTFNVDIVDPETGHTQLFSTNDVLRIKDGSGGDNWLLVSSVSDQTTFWRYVCSKPSGSNATFRAGAVVVDYGASGTGNITLSADGAVGSTPNINLATHAGAPYTTQTSIARIGNINGVLDYVSNTYGFAFGNLATPTVSTKFIAYDSTNGLRIQGNVVIGGGSNVNYGVNVGEALLMCHFDGPRPFEQDFTGNSNGSGGQVSNLGMAALGGFVFRPGKFGKAVQMAEATTNVFADSSFETSTLTTYWTVDVGGGTGAASSDTTNVLFGARALKMTKGTVYCSVYQSITTAATSYTISAYVYTDGTAVTSSDFKFLIDSVASTPTAFVNMGSGWYYAYLTVTETAAAHTTGCAPQGSKTVWVDGIQFESKAYPTPFAYFSFAKHTGSISTTSVRPAAATTLFYVPTGTSLIDFTVGTVMAWVYVSMARFNNSSQVPTVFTAYNTVGGVNEITIAASNNSGTPRWRVVNTVLGVNKFDVIVSAPDLTEGWHHVAITWTGTAFAFYADGVSQYTNTLYVAQASGTVYVGSRTVTDTLYPWNDRIDDFCILGSALSAAEINAIYTSNAPLVVTTSVSEIRLASPAAGFVAGNANGIFGVDVNGHATFGLTTTALNANTWGANQGESLDSGAIMIGSNEASYPNILWQPSTTHLLFRGGTTTNGFISTDGSLVILHNRYALVFFNADNVTTDATILYSGTDLTFITYAVGMRYLFTTTLTDASSPSFIWQEDGAQVNRTRFSIAAGVQGAKLAVGSSDDIIIQAKGTSGGTTLITITGGGLNINTTGAATGAIKASAGATINGALLWTTDNASDIGASGATRPRTLYLGTDLNAAGGLNVGTATGAAAGTMFLSGDRIRGSGATLNMRMKSIASLTQNSTAQLLDATNKRTFLIIMCLENDTCAIYLTLGTSNGVNEISDPNGAFSPTAGNVGTANIYWSAGNSRYEIENKIAGTRNFALWYWSDT